jgi:hypothetical protein
VATRPDFSAHWLVWSVAAVPVVVLSCLGLLTSTAPSVVIAWVGVSHFAGCGVYWLRVHAPSPVPVPVRRDLLLWAAVGTPLAMLVLVGLVGLAGLSGALLLALLLGASPGAVGWARSRLADRGTAAVAPRAVPPTVSPTVPPPATAPSPVTCPPADGLTTAQLCRAWRVSFTALDTVDRPEERAIVVQRRQEYLDALEHRDPRGFARWIGLGARAASDPGRYLAPDSDVEPPAA